MSIWRAIFLWVFAQTRCGWRSKKTTAESCEKRKQRCFCWRRLNREAVRDAINRLSDGLPRQVLALRYIDGLSWDEVQVKIGYESSQTYALHRKGLKELGRILFAK